MRLFICYTVKNSSVSHYWTGIVAELARRGHEVNVVSWGGNSGEEFRMITGANLFFFPSNRPTKLKDFFFFYKLVKEKGADVVIANFGSTNIAMLVAKILKVKHRCVYCHTLSSQIKMDSATSKIVDRYHIIRRSIVLKMVTTFFCNSESTKQEIHEQEGIPLNRILVRPLLVNGINKKHFSLEEREMMISFVGRFAPSKGQQDLIQALPLIKAAGYSPKVVFCGDGNFKKECISLSMELKVKDQCEFLGSVELDKVYDFLSRSVLSVSCSRHEAFGLVNLESISVGTPVVTTGVDGISEIISDGINGTYYEVGNPKSLANKIIMLLSEKDYWKQLSDNGLQIFNDKFSLINNASTEADKYIQLFC